MINKTGNKIVDFEEDFNKSKWSEIINEEGKKEYFISLVSFLEDEYKKNTVYPPSRDIFNAFKYTPYEDVKVVILGQDPYHEVGQSHGLVFSVPQGIKIPPSLRNILKELEEDIGVKSPTHGDLTSWANQGVLLLNTVLTVRKSEAGSHENKGWEIFTDKIIQYLSEREKPVVFILWGSKAQKKEELIDSSRHFIIKGVHPSPLSAYRGFFGKKYFSRTNEFLARTKQGEIDWEIPEK